MSFEVMDGPGARVLRRRKRKPRQDQALIRIVLIRHGKPNVEKGRWLTHKKFQEYIATYEAAGLDPDSPPPPEWLVELLLDARRIYASDRPRARESAQALAPHAELSLSPLFMEAQLKSPKLPIVRMKPPVWAVIARLAWHAGHHGGIEDFRDAKDRADKAVDMLAETAQEDGIAVLVAHGYFNAIVGRTLKKRGWRRFGGRHRAKFWNAVVYEREA
ncbi:MAG: histidine phosphatase family protein [Alphaproteobacteria bacterium]|nr:histidine phosphatase family protein [Alphaproteobacteria bacterium]